MQLIVRLKGPEFILGFMHLVHNNKLEAVARNNLEYLVSPVAHRSWCDRWKNSIVVSSACTAWFIDVVDEYPGTQNVAWVLPTIPFSANDFT